MAYVNLGQVMYPVGAIYQSWSSTSPANLFGGSWSQITEKFLYCSNSAGGTGGASKVTLSINQIPSHSHAINWVWNGGQHGNADWRIVVQGKNVASDSGTVEDAGRAIVSKGGGHLTRICHPISDVTLGEEQLSQYVIGGIL